MNKKIVAVFLCICLLSTAGCGKIAKLKNGEEVVGKIEGKSVTAEELYSSLKEQGGTSLFVNMIDTFIANKEVETTDTIKSEANSQLEQLKSQYTSAGQDFSSAIKNAGYKDENALLEVLILDVKKNTVVKNYLKENVSDDEINDYYESDIAGELTARHILITPSVKDDMTEEEKTKEKEKAKEKAEKLIKDLNDGSSFENLAKKNSDDTGSKKNGGLIENVTKDSVVEPFYNALTGLKDGEYTKEPVESTYGYHVILRVSQKEKPALKEVKDDIIDKIVTKKLTDDTELTTKTWVEIRTKKYKLEINDSKIKKGYEDLTK
ncbi:MAG: peptidylprolyl isomerase [Bacilli bacterium]|nr:peptidylprolyl isomerase [Bacilli bacterium]